MLVVLQSVLCPGRWRGELLGVSRSRLAVYFCVPREIRSVVQWGKLTFEEISMVFIILAKMSLWSAALHMNKMLDIPGQFIDLISLENFSYFDARQLIEALRLVSILRSLLKR